MIQSRIVDTSDNYGPGGLDFGAIYTSVQGIIPRFGVGYKKDEIFDDTMMEILLSGFPFQTYFIFGRPHLCRMSIREQCARWLDGRGVLLGRPMIDIEPALYKRDDTMIVIDELLEAIEFIEKYHPLPLSWYSSGRYINLLSWPRILSKYDLLAAQYPWEPWRFREYLSFDTFLRDRAGQLPPWVRGTIYQKCAYAWQFTAHGRTPDISKRVNGWSKGDHDFSVSTIDHADFMCKFYPSVHPPIEPDPEPERYQVQTIRTINLRNSPAGKDIGDVNGVLTIEGPSQKASYSGILYTWGHVVEPVDGWVALELTKRL